MVKGIGSIIVLFCLYSCKDTSVLKPFSKFTSLNVLNSGINFSNDLSYDEDFNVYMYRSFYNGAGVGIGDINNDGLPDVYFCGNQVDNQLYLNKGNLQFEDITTIAGVACSDVWSTGVSMVDINSDGWLDIYVCKAGKPGGGNRHNELFINQGVDQNGKPRFIESAKDYGIADIGLSVHAAFFDYDHDGDLDMYLLSNSIYPTDAVVDSRKGLRYKRDTDGGNKLYRQDEGFFTDVSEIAGIYGSAIGFGLGVSIGDVNKDNWPDIYVANDFFEKDYLYINNQDGTFTETLDDAIAEISQGSMGVDMADINHDGNVDIFVTEMLPHGDDRVKTKVAFDSWDIYSLKEKNGYHRQFPRNTFQLNNGNIGSKTKVSFSEISRLSKVDATDWSWGVLMADFNNNGNEDIYITNGIYKDLLDQDYLDFYSNSQEVMKTFREKGEIIKDLIDSMPSVPISNCLFTHSGNLKYEELSHEWGLGTPGFSSGSAYGDLDNDGDLDMVVNNINMRPFVYKNNTREVSKNHFLNIKLKTRSKNIDAFGAQVTIKSGGKLFFKEMFPMRGAMSTVDGRLHFGLGDINNIDTLEILWPDGSFNNLYNVSVDQFLTIKQWELTPSKDDLANPITEAYLQEEPNRMGIDYKHIENDFVDFDHDKLLYHMISSEGPKIAVGDINGDGQEDFYIGGAKGVAGALFEMDNSGSFTRTNVGLFEKDKLSEDTDATFFDLDNDGDEDLLVTSGGYEFSSSSFALADRIYINDGKGNLKRSSQIIPNNKLVSTSCVAVSDFDNDGDNDIFLGGRVQPLLYGVPTNSYLLENDGSGKFKDVTKDVVPGLLNVGMVTDAVWTDFDKDGDDDLILCGEWMPVKVFKNNITSFEEVTNEVGLFETNGFWHSLECADLDGDGDEDIIAGNLGSNTKFKASVEKPISMFINDFDQNGKIDHIITVFDGEKAYPIAPKKDITKQLPYLLKKYLKNEDYKGKTMQDIFSQEQLANSIKLKVFQSNSMVFWNEGRNFKAQELPIETQFGPVYSILVEDVDKDLIPDILLGGNLYKAKPQTGIYAGTYGTLLKNLGNRKFKYIKHADSGFFVKGEIRDMKKINVFGKNKLLVSRNNDSIKVFGF